MTFDELKEKAHSLPLKPGVYIMQDAKSQVIYVGKAKALKNRVSQYFANLASHTEKTRAMVSSIDHFDVIVVESEFEALVLECSLIKRHQPKYNILLKDDKGYPYIRLTVKETHPKFSLANKIQDDGARYFGPYGSRSSSKEIINALLETFHLPTCRLKFPRDIGRDRPCLNYHMGKCDGYCRCEMDQSLYYAGIRQAIRVLEGKQSEVIAQLTEQMEEAAQALLFEQAAVFRDRIRAVELLTQRQKVVAGKLADTDVIGFYRGEVKSCFVILHFANGELASKDMDLMETPMEGEEAEIIETLVSQYYGSKNYLPRQILLPCEPEDGASLARMLSEAAGHRVELVTPQRGAKMDLIRMAQANAYEEVERVTSKEERRSKLMEALGKLCGLETTPHRLESYDVSNQGADNIVASMVIHENARPKKSDYRHFKLRDMEAPNDYAAMEQVLTRRFQRYAEGNEKFSVLPDMILIDGGAEHARIAVRVQQKFGLSIPVFGMVKDDRHRTRGLVTPQGEELGLQHIPALFSLIGRIQEETHRFAIEFHRELQARRIWGSTLDHIPGVGEMRRTRLLKHFGSVRRVREATLEDLYEVLDHKSAKSVYDYFHPPKKPTTVWAP